MSFKRHENVRVSVVGLIAQSLKTVLESKCRVSQSLDCYVLKRLLEKPEGVTLLMPQEVYVGGERWAVDTLLGDAAVIEYKSHDHELKAAEESARGRYWGVVSRRKYYIVTTWDRWRIYRVRENGLQLVMDGDRDRAREILETQILPGLKEFKIPPLLENIEALYRLDHEQYLEDLKKAFEAVRDDPRVRPLYEAYKSIIQSLYGGAGEDFYVDLFIRHTYMQIAVLASLSIALGKTGLPEDVCSGTLLSVEIALPYLNWWKIALSNKNAKPLVKRVLEEVAGRAGLVDWSLDTAEDVFRTLYEFLVEPRVRRQLGEYYTPIWLVEMIIKEFDPAGKIVLDPFCGSGTFLIKAFYEKIERGEDPETALNEVAGFDVNPLAVAVARAELVLAYKRASGREPENPPHVYHVDTFATWFGGYVSPAMGLDELARKAREYLNTLIRFRQISLGNASDILASLRLIEKSLTYANRFSHSECGLEEKCLEEKITKYVVKNLENAGNPFIHHFLDHFKKSNVAGTIAKLIVRHGGNDVWAVVFTSIYAPILVSEFKPDIIVTNPPWIHVTEYKAPYSDRIRSYMLERIRSHISDKAPQILAGSDIAQAALAKSIELVAGGVGFIMNKDQLFNHRSSAPAGIVATYCMLEQALKNSAVALKLYDFDFDVFQHGILPAVAIVKKDEKTSWESELYVVKLKGLSNREYSKKLSLDEIKDYLDIAKYGKTYDEYVKPGLYYFTEDLDIIARKLGVDRVVPMGLFIRGIYGGEKKKGEEEYAGLALVEYGVEGTVFKFKLYNTSDKLAVPVDYLKKYSVKVFKMIYAGEINPFRVNRYLDIILSERGGAMLKKFLEESLKLNERRVSIETYNKIRKLVDELRQPDVIRPLGRDRFYVAFRCKRAFTAATIRPTSDDIIIESHVSYMETRSEDIAYYYTAILNYLAFKVMELKRTFIRSQFGKPVLAVYIAGLSWNSMDKDARGRIVELSKGLHEKTPGKEYSNQRIALQELLGLPEFKELVELADSRIDKERLEEALSLVSGFSAPKTGAKKPEEHNEE